MSRQVQVAVTLRVFALRPVATLPGLRIADDRSDVGGQLVAFRMRASDADVPAQHTVF